MSIIGEGKYVNYVEMDFRPSWQKSERYDYCERPVRQHAENPILVLRDWIKQAMSSKKAA